MARVITGKFQATKITYALLGNQFPHTHWQLIPRLATDPTSPEPIWRIKHTPAQLTTKPLQERIQHSPAGLEP